MLRTGGELVKGVFVLFLVLTLGGAPPARADDAGAGDARARDARAGDAAGGVLVQEPQPLPPEAQTGVPSRSFGMFGNVDYGGADRGARRGFSIGQLTLQYTSAFASRVLVFSEVTYSPRGDDGSEHGEGYGLEVERLIARYDYSDQLKISLGRYHTPVNWWNTAFHHGLWLQTTIARPEMVRFGGQFIPVHFVGALIEGATPAGGLNLNYSLGLGNGRSSSISAGGDAGDSNGARAWLANLFLRPDRLYGLQVGGSIYRDTLTPDNRRFTEWIAAAHLAYLREDPEIIAEYARVRHTASDGIRTNSDAYYVQIAYRLSGASSQMKPYYRYERMNVPAGEPIFTDTPGLTGNTVGLRYDFSELAAFKIEYREMRRTRSPGTRGLFGQVSFTF